MALNTLVAFVLLNLSAALWLRGCSDPEADGALTYGMERLREVYPDRSEDEIRQLLMETWSRRYGYEPFTQFKETEFAGEYVNVGPNGFRSTGRRLAWPPPADVVSVFVFGGSTTFGYGVADEETIPARLQVSLDTRCGGDVAVYNLARSNYYSSQENILFQRLLAGGVRPEAAVFVDGLNEFGHPQDEPKFTARLSYLMNETNPQRLRRVLVNLPLARLAKRWLKRPDVVQQAKATEEQAGEVIERWLANRQQIRAVAAASGVSTLFVWQPIPSYGYDLDQHPFAQPQGAQERASALGFERLDRLRKKEDGPLGAEFLWLADLQRERREPLYVDRVHYTAAFSAEIAERIGEALAPELCPAG